MFTLKLRSCGLLVSLASLLVVAVLAWPASLRINAADAGDSKLKVLLKERLAVLREVASQRSEAYRSGQGSFVEVLEANQAVGNAELDLCDTDKERIAVLERMLAEAKVFEKSVADRVAAGVSPTSAALKSKASRLEVEIALERIRGK